MKKLFFLIVLGVLSLTAGAQTRFGYFSYEEVLKSMPDYVLAQRSIDDLRVKYDAELKRAKEEFNSKYEEFLEVQKDLVPAILRKRQAELQEMMQKNINFKNESQRLLQQAETDAFAPVKEKLNEALTKVGQAKGYAFILNTDGNACPYVNPEMGENATEFVKEALNAKQ